MCHLSLKRGRNTVSVTDSIAVINKINTALHSLNSLAIVSCWNCGESERERKIAHVWVVLKIFTQKLDEHMKGCMTFQTVPSKVKCFAVAVTVRLTQNAAQS